VFRTSSKGSTLLACENTPHHHNISNGDEVYDDDVESREAGIFGLMPTRNGAVLVIGETLILAKTAPFW
jgi:hypothetical protein